MKVTGFINTRHDSHSHHVGYKEKFMSCGLEWQSPPPMVYINLMCPPGERTAPKYKQLRSHI